MLQKKPPPRVFCVAKKEGANGPYLFRNYEDLTNDVMILHKYIRLYVVRIERATRIFLMYKLLDNRTQAMFEGNSRVQVWQAIRCTSAAPTYFKRARVGSDTFVDGALAGAHSQKKSEFRT